VKTGIQEYQTVLDSSLRWSDPFGDFLLDINIDGPVKSRSQRICHFDQREKSDIFNIFRIQDFSLRSK